LEQLACHNRQSTLDRLKDRRPMLQFTAARRQNRFPTFSSQRAMDEACPSVRATQALRILQPMQKSIGQ